jgi:hypothetical protein
VVEICLHCPKTIQRNLQNIGRHTGINSGIKSGIPHTRNERGETGGGERLGSQQPRLALSLQTLKMPLLKSVSEVIFAAGYPTSVLSTTLSTLNSLSFLQGFYRRRPLMELRIIWKTRPRVSFSDTNAEKRRLSQNAIIVTK